MSFRSMLCSQRGTSSASATKAGCILKTGELQYFRNAVHYGLLDTLSGAEHTSISLGASLDIRRELLFGEKAVLPEWFFTDKIVFLQNAAVVGKRIRKFQTACLHTA